MSEEKIVEMTDAYITSYTRALEKTKNPNLAIQVAMGVCAILQSQPPKQEPQAAGMDPMGLFLAMALSGMKTGGEAGQEDPDPESEGRS